MHATIGSTRTKHERFKDWSTPLLYESGRDGISGYESERDGISGLEIPMIHTESYTKLTEQHL